MLRLRVSKALGPEATWYTREAENGIGPCKAHFVHLPLERGTCLHDLAVAFSPAMEVIRSGSVAPHSGV